MSSSGPMPRKRFWALAIFGGLLVACLVSVAAFGVLYHQASDRAANTVEYVKKQSLECELVNDANVMKSQIRVMQNASQAARDVEAGGGDVSEETLRRYVDDLHLTSMFVLSPEGEVVASYQGGSGSPGNLEDLMSKDEVLNVAQHAKKVYGTRLFFDDGTYADVACASRLDEPGIVAVVYATKAEYANRFLLTLQSLLDGYRIANDTSVIVERDGVVVASNTVGRDGQAASAEADNETVTANIRQNCEPGQMHLVKGESAYYYGAYGKTRDYTVYTFTKASRLLHYVCSSALAAVVLYAYIVASVTASRRRSEHEHLESMLAQEQRYTAQLEQAVREAQSANAAKTEFLQRMSHDLRTPLNGIRGMVEVGRAHPGDEQKQVECREKVWVASEMLLDLVNEALDMTKLESGQVTLELEPVDTEKIVDDVCGMVERQAVQRKVGISRNEVGVEHPWVKSSALYLRRLLMNVASNAVKYNKFGGQVRIEHRELSCVDGVATHQFTVEDTGIGMSPEFQQRLFEPFVREEQSLDYKPSGTGLGLAIAKQLVELMGGTIAFESELGRGTTCAITIPFEVAPEQQAAACGAGGEAAPTLLGLTILLAEDNELNREIAEFVISDADGTLCVAENGKQAVELFESMPPGTFDAVLLDIMMPVMDGYEAARAIRALPRDDAKGVPIIAVSANAFVDDRQRSIEAGMNAHLAKPLDPEELVRTITAAVHQACGGGAGSESEESR